MKNKVLFNHESTTFHTSLGVSEVEFIVIVDFINHNFGKVSLSFMTERLMKKFDKKFNSNHALLIGFVFSSILAYSECAYNFNESIQHYNRLN